MKVAVAGTGNVAQYLFEEIRHYGHDLVVLTRSAKAGRDFEQRETDYSVDSIVSVINDCDALVSTIADFVNPPVGTKIQLALLEACQKSKKCKAFLPSEFACDVESYPEQPYFLADANKKLHKVLESVTDVKWTILCNSWFADYAVPSSQRYLRDIGELWPMDMEKKVFTIYGPGTQLLDFTSVRDVAKGIAAMLDSKSPWEPYTFMSGHQLTLNEFYDLVKRRDPAWTSKTKPLADSVELVVKRKSPEDAMLGYFELLLYSGASKLPRDKVLAHRTKHFPLVHFRTIEELLDIASARPGEII